ncbi:hypothetical protein GCM10015535_21940 [Streptomyces gelaticus]|uniref:Uncharacterized protein n=1 Tax=Streptomyces gelaticus TaxID=285446 RepID=A0ABQ2VZG7_9ACTN|nr:hypothetical protein GCM10015535_21940 [Streptomyces gelaticus]
MGGGGHGRHTPGRHAPQTGGTHRRAAAVRLEPRLTGPHDPRWALLVRALETGAPDVVVVPATTLASLRQEDWDVPASIEQLAGAVSLSRRADREAAAARARR